MGTRRDSSKVPGELRTLAPVPPALLPIAAELWGSLASPLDGVREKLNNNQRGSTLIFLTTVLAVLVNTN